MSNLVKIGLVSLALALSGLVAGNALSSSGVEEVTLTATNHVTIREVNNKSVNTVIEAIRKAPKNEKFYLYIDGPGGEVINGLRLIKLLDVSPNVICVANTAISMDFAILQACAKRLVTKDAVLMQHRISGGARGNPDEIQTQLDMMKALEKMLNLRDSKRLGLSLEEFAKKVQFEWWIVGSDEILKNRAADGEVLVKCADELTECPLYE